MLRIFLLSLIALLPATSVQALVVTQQPIAIHKKTVQQSTRRKKKPRSAWRNLAQHVTIPSMDAPAAKPTPPKPIRPSRPSVENAGGPALPPVEVPGPPSAEEMEMMQALNDVFTAAAFGGGFDALFGG